MAIWRFVRLCYSWMVELSVQPLVDKQLLLIINLHNELVRQEGLCSGDKSDPSTDLTATSVDPESLNQTKSFKYSRNISTKFCHKLPYLQTYFNLNEFMESKQNVPETGIKFRILKETSARIY